ncbi:hypothetical protein AB0D49_33300 [Streptomyces sp. NPDC048290]|uniref:hypothetical protein n=1 Tax=Streptomyces sp. NPDC048290 TaxID=3155811 RepID=UPI00342DBA70
METPPGPITVRIPATMEAIPDGVSYHTGDIDVSQDAAPFPPGGAPAATITMQPTGEPGAYLLTLTTTGPEATHLMRSACNILLKAARTIGPSSP